MSKIELHDSTEHLIAKSLGVQVVLAWGRQTGWTIRSLTTDSLFIFNATVDSEIGPFEQWLRQWQNPEDDGKMDANWRVMEWRVGQLIYHGRALEPNDMVTVGGVHGRYWNIDPQGVIGFLAIGRSRRNGQVILDSISGKIEYHDSVWESDQFYLKGPSIYWQGGFRISKDRQILNAKAFYVDSGAWKWWLPSSMELPVHALQGSCLIDIHPDSLIIRHASWQLGNEGRWRGHWLIKNYRGDVQQMQHHMKVDYLSISQSMVRWALQPMGYAYLADSIGPIEYVGELEGRLSELLTQGQLTTRIGKLAGHLRWQSAPGAVRYQGRVHLSKVRLRTIWPSVPVDDLDAILAIHGGGQSVDSLQTHMTGTLMRVVFRRGRPVQNIVVHGYLTPQLFSGLVEAHNPHADFTFNGVVDFGGQGIGTTSQWEVGLLDLQALGLIPREARFGGNFSLHGQWNRTDSFQIDVDGNALYLASKDGALLLDSLQAKIGADGLRKTILLRSPAVTATLYGIFDWKDPWHLVRKWGNHFVGYPTSAETTPEEMHVRMAGSFSIYHPEVLLGLVDWDLHVVDSVHVQFDMDDDNLVKTILLHMGEWSAYGATGKGFGLYYGGDARVGTLQLRAENMKIRGRPFSDEVQFSAALSRKSATWNLLLVQDTAALVVPIRGRMHYRGADTFILDFDTTDWVIYDSVWRFSSTPWQVVWNRWWRPGDVSLRSRSAYLTLRRRMHPRERYELRAARIPVDYVASHLGGMLGEMGGQLFANLSWQRSNRLVHGQLRISPFTFTGDTLGTFQATLEAIPQRQRTRVVARLDGPQHQPWIRADGELSQLWETPLISMQAIVRDLPFQTLHNYYRHIISNLEGHLNAHVFVDGLLSAPLITGSIQAQRLGFTVNTLKTHYRFDHSFAFDHRHLRIDSLILVDMRGHTARADGHLDYDYFANTSIDLLLHLDTFTVLNTTAVDNDYFYGQAHASGRVSFSGMLSDVFMNAELQSQEGTAIDLPLGEGKIGDPYDFIEWITPQGVSSRSKDDDYSFRYFMTTTLTPMARIRIWVDPRTGEHVEGRGRGVLTFGEIERDGPFTIRGKYSIDEGHYHFVVLDVFERRFDILPGGYIQWRGDPYDAEIRITALHRVHADISDLLASSIPREQLAVLRGQRYPVDVFIYLGGALMHPEIRIDFEIHLPGRPGSETQRILLSAIQQIRQDPDELMRQVISLLVFERFLPVRGELTEALGSDAVYQNLSTILSAQLSRLLNRLTSDVEYIDNLQLGVAYNPGNDVPGTGLSRRRVELALSTQLFDERFYISGRYDLQNLLGNLEISYRLMPDRAMRIRAFVQNQQNLWLGQYSRQGIGISWSKDFDRWKTLFPHKKTISHDSIPQQP